MPRQYKSKRDANEPAIVDALRGLGASVERINHVPGFPDLIVGFRGVNLLMEVKLPSASLNHEQKTYHAQWRGIIHIVHGADEAIALLNDLC